MITIYVKTASEKAFAKTAMDRELMHNPNLNGADYEVVKDEDLAYSIDGGDNIVMATLMNVVFEKPIED